jgi:hypothetical protein
VMNNVGPIPAHRLGLSGLVAYGAWQATMPSGPVCHGLTPGQRRPMPMMPVGTHRPRSPCAVRRPWHGHHWCPNQLGVAGAAARAPGRRGHPAGQGVGEGDTPRSRSAVVFCDGGGASGHRR